MDKSAMPLKTKSPPSDSSEEETGSSDEETEDEEQAEGGSTFESGSDESTDTTKKKNMSQVQQQHKQQSTVKFASPAAAPGSPAKRTRESNGKKDKEDEPPNKRKKPEVATPTPRAAPKPTTQQLDKKSATKTERGKPSPPVKEKPSPAERKSASKRKPISPAPKSASSRSEDEALQKPKSLSRPWLPDEELALSRELQRDRVNDVYGSILPSSRSDKYWEKLMSRFSFMDKYEKEQRIERLCEKVRRMRLRYESLSIRIKAGETSIYKNAHEGVLWRIWHTIWGPHKATPKMLNGEDDDSEEDDEEEDDGSEEDDEEEIVPSQSKGRQIAVGRQTPAKKKLIGKKMAVDETSSDDDESNKDDSPVKATPPAVLAAPSVPVIPASAATPVTAKQAPASKSVPTKGPAVSAMDGDSGRNSSRAAVHNGAQGGHASIPAMIEKSVRADALPKVSDEMRAENLALLRDMRGTCVKMVEEAKAQSLLVTEKILDEARVKTSQIVEEARVKSAQIMEELRLLVERVGTVAGQSGRTNGSHGGRWNDMSENPYQGLGLLGNGELPLVDSSNVKWREQSEAEQGLLLQRLQLVQEQARIQQEGIRLKLDLQKQQALAQGKQA